MSRHDLPDRVRAFADVLAGLEGATVEVERVEPHEGVLFDGEGLWAEVSIRIVLALPEDFDSLEGVVLSVQRASLTNEGDIVVDCTMEVTCSGESDSANSRESGANTDLEGRSNRVETNPSHVTPPYQDSERLRDVYEDYDTFEQMTVALGVEVTPETVRRHMIECGIHEPRSRGRSGPDDEDGQIETEGERGETELESPPYDANGQTGSPEKDSVKEAGMDNRGHLDVALVEALELPGSVTVADLKTSVKTARTLHEVASRLDIERDKTRGMLQELGLFEFVTSRISRKDHNISDDEIEARIRRALDDDTDQGALSEA